MVNPNALLLIHPSIHRLIKHFIEDLVYSSHYAGWLKESEKKISEMQEESHMDPKDRDTALPFPLKPHSPKDAPGPPELPLTGSSRLSPFVLPPLLYP